MDLTWGREQVEQVEQFGSEFQRWGDAYEKERFPVWSFTEGTWSVTNEEERVDPGGLRLR